MPQALEEPPVAARQKFMVKLPRDLHRCIKLMSVETGYTMNEIIVAALEHFMSLPEDERRRLLKTAHDLR